MSTVQFTPVGVAEPVKLKVVGERRPGCCPDPKGCQPVYTTLALKEDLARGYSGNCYGYCGERVFVYDEATHRNDISRCMMTPLKGVVRFFTCYTDYLAEISELQRIAHMLNPAECEACKEPSFYARLTNYSNVTEKRHGWLCRGCAVRLQVAQFHPENIGTGRAVYF